ncbi:MAG: bifunctional ornithine acetyltransferase/N-acetylglutamate synthase [Spirochaetaceae bacterium]
MANHDSETAYREALARRGPFPDGFSAATTHITFTADERPGDAPYRMNLALIAAEEPTDAFAAVFTRNAFPGAPVVLGRRHLAEPTLQGVLVNNRISNVCSPTGLEDAELLAADAGRLVGGNGSEGAPFLSMSTGVIGWALPVDRMRAAIPDLVDALGSADPPEVAEAIMTTDSFPKVQSVDLGEGRIVGVAKGAGMVEPNLATMLAFITTDLDVERNALREDLAAVVAETFNTISIDGDQSTSDTVLAWSSRRKTAVPRERFREALRQVCAGLADDIVRNGEGVGHVLRVRVYGAARRADALLLGKAVCNSPLVKTAVYGNDPNVGRIIAALGDAAGNNSIVIDAGRMTVSLGAETIFRDGVFHLDRDKEARLCEYLADTGMDPGVEGFPQHERVVEIAVDLRAGCEEATVLGTDLTHDYIRKNADYRT